MNKNTIMRVSLALIFVSITLLIAALQIPHIGEGAPEWHTVRRPMIPASSSEWHTVRRPKALASGSNETPHADREIYLYKKHLKATAFWIDTLNCYCYFDEYGRLCAVPELR